MIVINQIKKHEFHYFSRLARDYDVHKVDLQGAPQVVTSPTCVISLGQGSILLLTLTFI